MIQIITYNRPSLIDRVISQQKDINFLQCLWC